MGRRLQFHAAPRVASAAAVARRRPRRRLNWPTFGCDGAGPRWKRLAQQPPVADVEPGETFAQVRRGGRGRAGVELQARDRRPTRALQVRRPRHRQPHHLLVPQGEAGAAGAGQQGGQLARPRPGVVARGQRLLPDLRARSINRQGEFASSRALAREPAPLPTPRSIISKMSLAAIRSFRLLGS